MAVELQDVRHRGTEREDLRSGRDVLPDPLPGLAAPGTPPEPARKVPSPEGCDVRQVGTATDTRVSTSSTADAGRRQPSGSLSRPGQLDQPTGGEHRDGGGDRQQVLEPLHRPDLEHRDRHHDPAGEQGLPPGPAPPGEHHRDQREADDDQPDRGRDVDEVEGRAVVGPTEHLPGEEVRARGALAAEHQRERVRRRHGEEGQARQQQVAHPDPGLAAQREVGVCRAEQQRPGLLRQERQPERTARGVEPHGPAGDAVAHQQVQGDAGEEGHRSVEQDLPRDDHVVRHQGEDRGSHQPDPAAVELGPGHPHHHHGADPEGGREQPPGQVGDPVEVEQREERLEQHRVGPEDREVRRQRGVPGDARRLPRVDRLVAVVAQGTQRDHAHPRADGGDGRQRERPGQRLRDRPGQGAREHPCPGADDGVAAQRRSGRPYRAGGHAVVLRRLACTVLSLGPGSCAPPSPTGARVHHQTTGVGPTASARVTLRPTHRGGDGCGRGRPRPPGRPRARRAVRGPR